MRQTVIKEDWKRYLVLILKTLVCASSLSVLINTIVVNELNRDSLTFGSCAAFALRLLFSLIAVCAICYSVFHFEELYKARVKGSLKGVPEALFFSVFTVLFVNPLDWNNARVNSFERVIGEALIYEIDVSKRIRNFNLWFFLLAAAFILSYLLINYIYSKSESEDGRLAVSFTGNFAIIADCCLVLRLISFFYDKSSPYVFCFSSYAMTMVFLSGVAYLSLHLYRNLSFASYLKLHFIGFCVSMPASICFFDMWEGGSSFLGVWAVVSFFIVCSCRFIKRSVFNRIESYLLNVSKTVSFIPLLTSLFIEAVHVLNQYSVFIAHPQTVYLILMLLLMVFTVVFTLFKSTGKDGFVLPVFVLGVSFLSVQIPLSSVYSFDLFETANYGVLINDFLNYGTIPIVQHYGGHMMTSVWEGIIYGLVNHDYYGAMVSPYASLVMPFLAVLFYFFIKEIWNREMAVLAVLFFPFYSYWEYYGWGMLVCLLAVAYIRKSTYIRAALMWGAVIWCALYRLDIGFSFGFAVVASLLIYFVVFKKFVQIKPVVVTLLAWGVAGISIWCAICLIKSVNPFDRLMEFLMISASNQNWAYFSMGDTSNSMFPWLYIIIPFMVALGLLCIVVSTTVRSKIGVEKWILLMMLGWAYFGNFSRGIVRHSMFESASIISPIVIWTGYVFIALFICFYKDNVKLFLPLFLALILCNNLFLQSNIIRMDNVIDSAMERSGSVIESWKTVREDGLTLWEQIDRDKTVVSRVVIDDSIVSYANKYRMIDVLLDEDETFIDFTNKTVLYPILEREDPVYVSQSPLQLSGEFSQEQFINQMSGVPLVLMPADLGNFRASTSLDGINNAYRYYKISEYIYANYVPLYAYRSDYAVWCLKDRYDEYSQIVSAMITGVDYTDDLTNGSGIECWSSELVSGESGSVVMNSLGFEPIVTELQNVIDISTYIDSEMMISIDYTTSVDGRLLLFYTTDEGEEYSIDKVEAVDISGSGTAVFTIPVTEATRLRLQFPDESTVTMNSIRVSPPISLVGYGYDGPVDGEFLGSYHIHYLASLPRIWAEYDSENAIDNSVVADTIPVDGYYIFDSDLFEPNAGNYCLIEISYFGENESTDAFLYMGDYTDGVFTDRCVYNFSVDNGTHYYLIRCSTDYYWYIDQVNAFRIQTSDEVSDVSISVLEGD